MLSPTQYAVAKARLDHLIRESNGNLTKIQTLLKEQMHLRDAYYGKGPPA